MLDLCSNCTTTPFDQMEGFLRSLGGSGSSDFRSYKQIHRAPRQTLLFPTYQKRILAYEPSYLSGWKYFITVYESGVYHHSVTELVGYYSV